jgi:hypothetical protein
MMHCGPRSQWRLFILDGCRFFELTGNFEKHRFIKMTAHDLQTDGQAVIGKPQGTEIPGMPARLADKVKMSDRYIANGSSRVSPMG